MTTPKLTEDHKDLSTVVEEQCSLLQLSFPPKVQKEDLTEQEKLLVDKHTFPAELDFTVKVDLASSKKAFLSLVSGLCKDTTSFEDLWTFKKHDPTADYCPIKDWDVLFLEDGGDSSSDEEEMQKPDAKRRKAM